MIVGVRSGSLGGSDRCCCRPRSWLRLYETQLNVGADKVVVAKYRAARTGSRHRRVLPSWTASVRGSASCGDIVDFAGLRAWAASSSDRRKVLVGGPRIVVMSRPVLDWKVPADPDVHHRALSRTGETSVISRWAFRAAYIALSFRGLRQRGLAYPRRHACRASGPAGGLESLDPHGLDEYCGLRRYTADQVPAICELCTAPQVGQSAKPCVLKRGLAATVTEWLQATDYVLAEGNTQVMLCEQGIRTFEDSTRFTLDIASIGVIKRNSHLPVIVDPSHAAGHYALVPTLARAAVAAGADGLIIEVHPDPVNALSDGLQSLSFTNFSRLMDELRPLASPLGAVSECPLVHRST